ncbi:MAG TPA: Hsp20/alpha crystallin family protein [Thermoplasmata archaeon]|nr:Hsp20/alpha crystallin family protein [Thermoplasmata archaeon]
MTQATEKSIAPTDPWTDLETSLDALRSRFLATFGGSPFLSDAAAEAPTFRPARVDVADTGTAYRITAEVPGIPKEQLEIHVKGAEVEIRGEQSTATETKDDGTYLRRERTYAGYYRSLELPEPVVGKDATAKLEHGVLVLELPKEHPTPSPSDVKVRIA